MSVYSSVRSFSACLVLAIGCGGAEAPGEHSAEAPIETSAPSDAEAAEREVITPVAPANALANKDEPEARSPKLSSLRQALQRASADLSVVQRDDGIKQLRVLKGWRSASLLTPKRDGGLQQSCVDSADQLDHARGAQP